MDSDLELHVIEPTRQVDKYNSYINYKITVKTSRPGFAAESIVVRRYSDFVWLSEDLSRLHPGLIIPTLPEKQSMGRFSPEFVEARRRALEKFLERISEHVELGKSATFITFLQATDIQLNEAKEISKAAKVKVTEKAKSWLQGVGNSLTAAATNQKAVEPEKTPVDLKVDEIAAYALVFEKQLDIISKQSRNIVKRSGEAASALYDFSQGLANLGKAEGEALGAALNHVGQSIEKLSYEAAQHAELELRELEEPIDEYVRYAQSVKSALQRRVEKRNALKAANLDMELKEQSYHKVMGIAGKEKDAATKQEAFEKALAVHKALQQETELISNQLVEEFEIFKKQKAEDFRNIILKFALIQAEYNKKNEEFWRAVLPTLQSLDGGAKGVDVTVPVPDETFPTVRVMSIKLQNPLAETPDTAHFEEV